MPCFFFRELQNDKLNELNSNGVIDDNYKPDT